MSSETSREIRRPRQYPKEDSTMDNGRESLHTTIGRLYGEDIYLKTRKLDKLRKKRSQLLCSLAFLRRCRDQEVTPTFVRIRHHIQTTTASRIIQRTEKALTRERVRYTYHQLNIISLELLHLHLQLSNILDEHLWKKIDEISYEHAEHHMEKVTKIHIKKFEKLQAKNISTPKPELDKTKTVVNLSSQPLSEAATSVLAKGLNFAIAPKNIPKEEIIAQVETAIRTLPVESAEEIRHETCRILRKAKPPKRNITKEEEAALREIRNNRDIVVLRADKGNATVVMNKLDYQDKISSLLDPDHYTKLNKDPTAKIERQTRTAIKKSSIPQEEQRNLLPSETKPPRLYGLPKIHKAGHPLRPIVSTCGSPTYELARYIANKLQVYVGKTESFVKNSEHFIDILRQQKITNDDILVSFDVESLYTNVPVDEAIHLIRQQFVPQGLQEDILNLAELCLNTTYFLWNGDIYEQKSGAAMGSPLSPVIANIFMEAFEEAALLSSDKKPKCWFRYVDDTFVIWPHGATALQEFLSHLNNQHPNIKFTMEMESNGSLPFLDVLVRRKEDNTLGHAVYRKPTHTDRYLHATSHHHPQQKRSLINTLVRRAEKISDITHKPSEMKHLQEALEKNGYKRQDITRASRIRENKQLEENITTYAVLPYISGVTDRMKKVLKKHNIGTRFGTIQKIEQLLPTSKDQYPRLQTKGVYKLTCNCGQSYVGQTGRSITCRIKEHQRDTRLGNKEKSAVAEHLNQQGNHNINFEETEVLARSTKYYPRIIRESIEIMKTPHNFNREDGYRLSNTWKLALNSNSTNPPERNRQPTTTDVQRCVTVNRYKLRSSRQEL